MLRTRFSTRVKTETAVPDMFLIREDIETGPLGLSSITDRLSVVVGPILSDVENSFLTDLTGGSVDR
jgi:hypothetical protein